MVKKYRYETIAGFFHQDDPTTDPSTFDYTNSFGLIQPPDTPPQETWSTFAATLSTLNHSSPAGTSYTLLLLARHGEGDHNVAEARYGTAAWDVRLPPPTTASSELTIPKDHYSFLPSLDGARLTDARLTPRGQAQARLAGDTFRAALGQGMPAPQLYLCSPLDRCLETCALTFGALELPAGREFRPEVRELLREVVGEHTCDQRSSAAEIRARWPDFGLEPGFAEQDELWRPDVRETDPELDRRLERFLDGLFAELDAMPKRPTCVSLTTHSGAIGGFQRVLGHRDFPPGTGSVMPVVVKAVEV